jgi:hypothetical protein
MDEYLNTVFITDQYSSKFQVSTFPSGVAIDAPQVRHVAQYLLRTNVAIELATAENATGIPYHPHSHRTRYVLDILRKGGRFTPEYLLRYLESEIAQRRDDIRSALPFAFPSFMEQAPLIMTVFSGSTCPKDILKRTLEIRETKQAIQYRRFVANLMSAFEKGDARARRRA